VANSKGKSKLKIQSPALGFLHEASHALQEFENPKQKQIDLGTSAGHYEDAEEQRVIDKVETPAAKKLGEPIRTNHYGKAVTTKTPTCHSIEWRRVR